MNLKKEVGRKSGERALRCRKKLKRGEKFKGRKEKRKEKLKCSVGKGRSGSGILREVKGTLV